MENIELISFQLISNVGDAKSNLLVAMKEARAENFEEAEAKVAEAEKSLLKAHESHFSLIQEEAEGNKVDISLILMHAEDQLMTTETLKIIVEELILTHKKYSSK